MTSVDHTDALKRAVERERVARKSAEGLLEQKSYELYVANQNLQSMNTHLEARVEQRTRELEQVNAALKHRMLHDELTGLANRTLFLERVEHAIPVALRRQTRVAVMFVDLDKFKCINDSLGHAA